MQLRKSVLARILCDLTGRCLQGTPHDIDADLLVVIASLRPSSVFSVRRIIHTGIFEAVFRHRDGVRASMPFTYEPGAWLQAEAGIRGDSACGLEDLRQRLQLAPGRLAKSTVLVFLQAVADPPVCTENFIRID